MSVSMDPRLGGAARRCGSGAASQAGARRLPGGRAGEARRDHGGRAREGPRRARSSRAGHAARREAPMILDAGALIAVSRNDRAMIARLVAAEQEDEEVSTHPMVVAQVWRDGGRQAVLARLLRGVQIVAIDDELGRRCGGLLGKADRKSVVQG